MKKLFLTGALVLFAFPFGELSAQKPCNNDSECGRTDRGIQNICFRSFCYRGCNNKYDCPGRQECNRGSFCEDPDMINIP